MPKETLQAKGLYAGFAVLSSSCYIPDASFDMFIFPLVCSLYALFVLGVPGA